MGESRCGEVRVKGRRNVEELQYKRVAMWESCSIGELRCGRVAVKGSCGVGEMQCGGDAVWGSHSRSPTHINFRMAPQAKIPNS